MKKLFALTIAVGLTFGVTGCNSNITKKGLEAKSSVAIGDIAYPIETDVTLTYWVRLVGSLGTSVTNYSETRFAEEYMKKTGIKIAYQHPAQGQEKERLNLLIASGDLPDIIESDWLSRDPDSYIAKNTILKLNDIFDEQAPNIKKFLTSNPDIDKAVKTDSGSYYVFPFVRNGEKLLSTAGFMIRQDWLSELNLTMPETAVEWEIVLTEFKNKKGAKSPLLANMNAIKLFTGAFDIGYSFYLDDGQVRYGSMEKAFNDYIVLMRRWYQNGLIDKNFAIMDNDFITSGMLDGSGGATFGAGGGAMGLYLNTAKETGNTDFSLAATKFPTAVKGAVPGFSQKQWPYSALNGAAITGNCKNSDIAARFLDYSYSQEGHMLNNFGVEGESYEMVGDYPEYTDLITNNSNKLSMSRVLPIYVRSANEGPFLQDERYIEQYYQLDAQKNALDVWSQNEYEKHALPQITLTKEEITEFNKIMSDINIFEEESVIGFIVGSKPLSDFEAYISELKSLKIDRAIEIQQAAYERFLKRQ